MVAVSSFRFLGGLEFLRCLGFLGCLGFLWQHIHAKPESAIALDCRLRLHHPGEKSDARSANLSAALVETTPGVVLSLLTES